MHNTKTTDLTSSATIAILSDPATKVNTSQHLAGTEYSNLSMYQDFMIELPPVMLMALLNQYGLKAHDVKGDYTVDINTLASLNEHLAASITQTHVDNQNSLSSSAQGFTLQSIELLAKWSQQMSWLQFNQQINQFLLAWLNDYKLGVSVDDGFKILNCLSIQKITAVDKPNATSEEAGASYQSLVEAQFQRLMMHLIARVTSQLDQYKFHYVQNFDIETSLPNEQLMRKFIHQRLEDYYQHQQRNPQENIHLGLIIINLNINFDEETQLNTSASVLLKSAVHLIELHLNDDATIFRVGTGELGILLANLHFPAQINLIASRIAHAFESALPIDNITLILKPYLGCVGSFNFDSSNKRLSAIAFYEHARLALHHAMIKDYQIEVYDAHITASFSSMHALDEAIINALQQNELTIYLQPIVTLPAEVCMNAEILLRWDNDEWQSISPARLIDSIYKKGVW